MAASDANGTAESIGQLRAAGYALLMSVGGPVFGIVVLSLAGLVITAGGVEITDSLSIILSLVFLTGVGFIGASIMYLKYRDLSWDFVPIDFPSVRDVIWAGAGYVLGLLGVFVVAFLFTTFVGQPESSNQATETAMQNPELYLVLIPASFLLIGPGEELLFRGVVQGTFREAYSAPIAIVAASAIFAAIHFAALTGGAFDRLIVLFILFVPSLVMGVAYERTQNLLVPILIHGAYDATIFSLQYVVVRYFPEQVEEATAFLVF